MPVELRQLRPSSQIAAADWIAPRLSPFASGISGVVPNGFPAYCRILHPAIGAWEARTRWADVAAASGATMHRLVQFHAINRSPDPYVGVPEPGNLPAAQLQLLCAALAA